MHIPRCSCLWYILIPFYQISHLWPLQGIYLLKNLYWTRINNCLSLFYLESKLWRWHWGAYACILFFTNWIKVEFHSAYYLTFKEHVAELILDEWTDLQEQAPWLSWKKQIQLVFFCVSNIRYQYWMQHTEFVSFFTKASSSFLCCMSLSF